MTRENTEKRLSVPGDAKQALIQAYISDYEARSAEIRDLSQRLQQLLYFQMGALGVTVTGISGISAQWSALKNVLDPVILRYALLLLPVVFYTLSSSILYQATLLHLNARYLATHVRKRMKELTGDEQIFSWPLFWRKQGNTVKYRLLLRAGFIGQALFSVVAPLALIACFLFFFRTAEPMKVDVVVAVPVVHVRVQTILLILNFVGLVFMVHSAWNFFRIQHEDITKESDSSKRA